MTLEDVFLKITMGEGLVIEQPAEQNDSDGAAADAQTADETEEKKEEEA